MQIIVSKEQRSNKISTVRKIIKIVNRNKNSTVDELQ